MYQKILHTACLILYVSRSHSFGHRPLLTRRTTTSTTILAAAPSNTTTWSSTTVRGPDPLTKPNYDAIHGPLGPLMDAVFLAVFRHQLSSHTSIHSERPLTEYQGIIEITAEMNRRYRRDNVQARAQNVLRALFPSWMPSSYAVLFSQPFPAWSARMNAWATMVAGTWLMGECEINDIELEDGTIGKSQGLLVKRCRFLEESGCASVCVNSCKLPTQNFFLQDMGLPLTMEPDYDTFECQFSFGKAPTLETETLAALTPCLSRCPSAGGLRRNHNRPDEACTLMND